MRHVVNIIKASQLFIEFTRARQTHTERLTDPQRKRYIILTLKQIFLQLSDDASFNFNGRHFLDFESERLSSALQIRVIKKETTTTTRMRDRRAP